MSEEQAGGWREDERGGSFVPVFRGPAGCFSFSRKHSFHSLCARTVFPLPHGALLHEAVFSLFLTGNITREFASGFLFFLCLQSAYSDGLISEYSHGRTRGSILCCASLPSPTDWRPNSWLITGFNRKPTDGRFPHRSR